jgi:hypothetical protein
MEEEDEVGEKSGECRHWDRQRSSATGPARGQRVYASPVWRTTNSE